MNVILRADASVEMGTGHVMRSLALAQAWQEVGGLPVFAMAKTVPAISARLASEGIGLVQLPARAGDPEDARATAELSKARDARWVVIDGYQFDSTYQRTLKEAGLRVLTIDDYGHADHYYADAILNQNIYAAEGLYRSREPETRLLLGLRYALLRREFWACQAWERAARSDGNHVLVTLGGADPANLTARVLAALDQVTCEEMEVRAVVGGANPHRAGLEALAAGAHHRMTVLHDVSSMPELMAWADVAVSAAGTTCWELACLGLPAALLILADNQRAVAVGMARAGLAANLGWHPEVTPENIAGTIAALLADGARRSEMSRRGRALVDGQGARRVRRWLEGELLELRAAGPGDARLIWTWADDPEVRAVSFSTEPIPWEEHLRWYTDKLAGGNCLIYIGMETSGAPAGQIRFDLSGDDAVVSIVVDRRFRGQGYGSALLRHGVATLFEKTAVKRARAFVKPGNEASAGAFRAAGFRELEPATVKGALARQFTWEKDGSDEPDF